MRLAGHWNRLPRQSVEEVSILSECEYCPTAVYVEFKLDHGCMCMAAFGTGAEELCPSQDLSAWTASCNSIAVRKKTNT